MHHLVHPKYHRFMSSWTDAAQYLKLFYEKNVDTTSSYLYLFSSKKPNFLSVRIVVLNVKTNFS